MQWELLLYSAISAKQLEWSDSLKFASLLIFLFEAKILLVDKIFFAWKKLQMIFFDNQSIFFF